MTRTPHRRGRLIRAAVTSMLLLVASGVPAVGGGGSAPAGPDRAWVATWTGNSQMPSATVFSDQTVRLTLAPHTAGTELRLRLSHRYGDDDVKIDDIYVGRTDTGASVVADSNTAVTFGGRPEVTLFQGGEAVSDPIPLPVRPFESLSVSFHVAGDATLDQHLGGTQTSYLTPPGSGAFGDEISGAPFTLTTSSWFAAAAIDVKTAAARAATVVAFGDSLTDGAGTTFGAHHRWPDFLARRLLQDHRAQGLTVVNAGVGGNSLTTLDSRGYSVSGVARFDDDVLDQTGVRTVIVFIGGNDLIRKIPAQTVIDGLRNIAARAHARGVKVVGATVTPRSNFNADIEAQRQELNEWIRTSDELDAVVDFDATVRDPAAPNRLLPAYAYSDGIHLNDAGAEAIADAVDISELRRLSTR